MECPIARAEPVARTPGGSGENHHRCMQENALNYLATASYHNQAVAA